VAARKALNELNGGPPGHRNGDGVEPSPGEAPWTSDPAICGALELIPAAARCSSFMVASRSIDSSLYELLACHGHNTHKSLLWISCRGDDMVAYDRKYH
jgi:hypothetical protein